MDNDAKMATDNRQIKSTISPRNYKLLQKWANFHGKTPGEFAGQIIASRLEANVDLILRLSNVGRELDAEPEDSEEESE